MSSTTFYFLHPCSRKESMAKLYKIDKISFRINTCIKWHSSHIGATFFYQPLRVSLTVRYKLTNLERSLSIYLCMYVQKDLVIDFTLSPVFKEHLYRSRAGFKLFPCGHWDLLKFRRTERKEGRVNRPPHLGDSSRF